MARTPFLPPQVAADPQSPSQSAPLPTRKRGEYKRWQLGQAPAPAIRTREEPPAAPAGPDPLEVAFENAKAEGFEHGQQIAFELVEKQYAARVEAVERSLGELSALHAVLGEIYRREMVEVALCAAEALVQRDLRDSTATIEAMVTQALVALGGQEALRLSVSAEDAPRLAAWVEQAQPSVEIHVDPRRSVGDFRLDGAAGSVECSVRERIDRIRQLVVGELATESNR